MIFELWMLPILLVGVGMMGVASWAKNLWMFYGGIVGFLAVVLFFIGYGVMNPDKIVDPKPPIEKVLTQ